LYDEHDDEVMKKGYFDHPVASCALLSAWHVRTAENRGNHGGKRANFWLDRLNGIFVETLSLRSESAGRARRLSLGISSPLSDLQSLGQLPREAEK
jgi:hypothetical protein